MRLFSKHNSFSAADAENALTLRKCLWAAIAILPVAKRVSLFFANRTRVTPNQLTIAAFMLCVVGAGSFAVGGYWFLVAGALLFEINYMLDCVDGTVAKLTGRCSQTGAFLDFLLDQWRIFFCLAGLVYGQYRFHAGMPIVIAASYYLFIKLLYVYHGNVRQSMISKFGRWAVESSLEYTGVGLLARWRRFAERRKLAPRMRSVETDTIVFFIGPVLNQVFWGMMIGSALLTLLYVAAVIRFIWELRYSSLEKDIRDIFLDDKIRNVAVFGTGSAAGNFMSWCRGNSLDSKIGFFLDNNPARHGTQRFNRPVHNPDILRKEKPDLVVVTSRNGHWDIAEQLEDMGMNEQRDFIYANFSR